jgi:hypothetical protein
MSSWSNWTGHSAAISTSASRANGAAKNRSPSIQLNLSSPDVRTPRSGSHDCVCAGLIDEWLQGRNELRIKIFCGIPAFRRSPGLPRQNASSTASSGGTGASAASLRHPSLVDAVHPSSPNPRYPRCGGGARSPGSPHCPLIEPLRQPSLSRVPKGRGGLSKKNFDPQRERHLQPLVDGIGAGEQETCCNQLRDQPKKKRPRAVSTGPRPFHLPSTRISTRTPGCRPEPR